MNGRQKRKLISSNDTEEDDADDNIFSYSLDKLKALQRKEGSLTLFTGYLHMKVVRCLNSQSFKTHCKRFYSAFS